MTDKKFMERAIELAGKGMASNAGGPFGAVVVKDGVIISEASNRVTSDNDPTAHAEVLAIREACRKLGTYTLEGCTIYTSCEPCPMCLGAIYWARPVAVVYACDRTDAADAGFDDRFIYDEISLDMGSRLIPFSQTMRDKALPLFTEWREKEDAERY
ncbi:MAG: nucleoside deaminase [Bacteroidales bacterium]|nr:nucleoside deaminase [Bacteroidales bacterium]